MSEEITPYGIGLRATMERDSNCTAFAPMTMDDINEMAKAMSRQRTPSFKMNFFPQKGGGYKAQMEGSFMSFDLTEEEYQKMMKR